MRLQLLLVCMVLFGAAPAPARAQSHGNSPLEPPGALVAALDVALYNAKANVREPTDAAAATRATEVLRATLAKLLPGQLADSAAVQPPLVRMRH
ncbi:MAG: hypothetical protein ACREMX_17810 [Gemmatimonadales bacterium]